MAQRRVRFPLLEKIRKLIPLIPVLTQWVLDYYALPLKGKVKWSDKKVIAEFFNGPHYGSSFSAYISDKSVIKKVVWITLQTNGDSLIQDYHLPFATTLVSDVYTGELYATCFDRNGRNPTVYYRDEAVTTTTTISDKWQVLFEFEISKYYRCLVMNGWFYIFSGSELFLYDKRGKLHTSKKVDNIEDLLPITLTGEIILLTLHWKIVGVGPVSWYIISVLDSKTLNVKRKIKVSQRPVIYGASLCFLEKDHLTIRDVLTLKQIHDIHLPIQHDPYSENRIYYSGNETCLFLLYQDFSETIRTMYVY